MGWSNPDVPWSALEAALSGRTGLAGGPEADGGDAPAWSRKRAQYLPAEPVAAEAGPRVPAAELGVRTVFGAELSLGLTAPQNGVADPEGNHLLLLARDPQGYRGLCRTISTAQLTGQEKGRPVYDLDEVVADTAGHVLVLTGCRKGA